MTRFCAGILYEADFVTTYPDTGKRISILMYDLR